VVPEFIDVSPACRWSGTMSVRRLDVAKRDLTTALMVYDVADLFERPD